MGDHQPRRLEERVAAELGLALLMLGLALLQAALLPRPFGAPPHLLLLLVVCQALIAGPSNAARWAFYGGLALDICAGSPLGTHALALLLAALLGSLPFMRLNRDSWLLPLGGMALGGVVYHAALAPLLGGWPMLADPALLATYARVVLVPGLSLVLIPALPVFLLMRQLQSRRRGEVPVDVY